MHCPKCDSLNFKPFEIEGVTVDFCGDCMALWFEKGELAFYAEAGSDVPALRVALQSAKQTGFSCPQCKTETLVEFAYHPKETLLVDYCQKCHGILLDRGEVAKVEAIIARYGLVQLGSIMREFESRGYAVMASS